jgi:hypothetical protein
MARFVPWLGPRFEEMLGSQPENVRSAVRDAMEKVMNEPKGSVGNKARGAAAGSDGGNRYSLPVLYFKGGRWVLVFRYVQVPPGWAVEFRDLYYRNEEPVIEPGPVDLGDV